jgi:hypothetical protein
VINHHPFFVHAPIVLIPLAAVMVWLSRAVRKEGFETATLLITLAGVAGALGALISGLLADGSFPADAMLAELVQKHEYNGIAVTVIGSVAALVSLAEWRGFLPKKVWWIKGALLTWCAIGCFTGGHSGAHLVYEHGAAVARKAP